MNSDLNILDLVLHASLPVKLVLLLLLIASLLSWIIIFRKKMLLDAANRNANAFEERFWSGVELAALYRETRQGDAEAGGLAAIFEAGFHEYARERRSRKVDARSRLESAERAMRVSLSREVDRLDQNLEFLASVGSISPYVGLFGTVWGIMVAFQGLANVKEATIAMVAPGISEALVATAMGLFAAIPATWAYNRYANKVERLNVRYETFLDEFSAILQRQLNTDEDA